MRAMTIEQLFTHLHDTPQTRDVNADEFHRLIRLELNTHKRLVVTRDDRWVVGNSTIVPPYARKEQ
jgi:hypothetical protein